MNLKLGVFLKIAACLCSTLMLACVKGLHGTIPTGEVIFFRSFVALFPLLGWLTLQGNVIDNLKTNNLLGHFIRGFSGTGGMYFNYLALVYISLADATALSYAAPMFTVMMAVFLLKEHVRISRWLAVMMGLCGIVIMLSASLRAEHAAISGTLHSGMTVGIIFALIAALCTATSNIQIRFLTGIEKPGAIVFYFSVMTTLIGLATYYWGWIVPSWRQLLLLIGCGLFGGMAQILVTLSLRFSDASLLAPFDYSTLVWSMMIGYLFLNSLPLPSTLIGAAVVASAGIFTLWSEQRRRRWVKG